MTYLPTKLLGQVLPALSSLKIMDEDGVFRGITLNQPRVESLYMRWVFPRDLSSMSKLTELVLDSGAASGYTINGLGDGSGMLDMLRQVASHLSVLKILGRSSRHYPALTPDAVVTSTVDAVSGSRNAAEEWLHPC